MECLELPRSEDAEALTIGRPEHGPGVLDRRHHPRLEGVDVAQVQLPLSECIDDDQSHRLSVG